ncbi:MAG: hypothetical protein CL928_18600 [Deltaproteobacteria bacterium]|nr:hypothetical protein [Deltaproteobacteria bacterium]
MLHNAVRYTLSILFLSAAVGCTNTAGQGVIASPDDADADPTVDEDGSAAGEDDGLADEDGKVADEDDTVADDEDGPASDDEGGVEGDDETGSNEEDSGPTGDDQVPTGEDEDTVDTPEPSTTFHYYTIDAASDGPAFADVGDVDGDGTLDVIIASFGSVGFNIPAGEVNLYTMGESLSDPWTKEAILPESEGVVWPNHVELHDLDDDGDLDLMVPSGFLVCETIPFSPTCGGLLWMEQTSSGWVRHDIVPEGASLFYHSVDLVDFNGDGLLDLVTTAESNGGLFGTEVAELQWFEGQVGPERWNPDPYIVGDGLGSFPRVLDIDGDGDLDVGGGEFFSTTDSFAWFERTADPSSASPSGEFVRHVIDGDSGPSIQGDFVEDFFGDGATVLIGSNHTNTAKNPPDPWESAVYAYEPGADVTDPWNKSQLSTGIVSEPGSMFSPAHAPGIFGVGDLDGDGDMDIAVSGDGDPNVYWIEQTETGFATHLLISNLSQAGGMVIEDLDGNGTNEIIVTGYDAGAVYVFERD